MAGEKAINNGIILLYIFTIGLSMPIGILKYTYSPNNFIKY